MSHEIGRIGCFHRQKGLATLTSSTSKLKSYSTAKTGSFHLVRNLASKGSFSAQHRDLCSMAPSKYSNKKPPLTHFLCLPLLTTSSIPQLQESLAPFKQSVTRPARSETPATAEEEADASTATVVIPEKAFRPLGVLHLTLGVMSLRSEEKMNDAKGFLEGLNLSELLKQSESQSVDSIQGNHLPNESNNPQTEADPPPEDFGGRPPTLLETLKRAVTPPFLSRPTTPARPLSISLRGLQAFPKPSEATVLHCPPHDPTSRLYPFCLKLKQRFIDAGFMDSENRPLVLHATIVNTVYAKTDRRHEKRRMGSITFDATEIMRTYNEKGGIEHGDAMGEFVWATDILIDRVRICKMGAKVVEDSALRQEYVVLAEKLV